MAEGQIMKALSGFYYVKSNDNLYACKGRGVFRNQNITPLVGDYVTFDHTEEGEGYIQKIKARHNELDRPPIANITQTIDRKSTRLNSSHVAISYAAFCLKKKTH